MAVETMVLKWLLIGALAWKFGEPSEYYHHPRWSEEWYYPDQYRYYPSQYWFREPPYLYSRRQELWPGTRIRIGQGRYRLLFSSEAELECRFPDNEYIISNIAWVRADLRDLEVRAIYRGNRYVDVIGYHQGSLLKIHHVSPLDIGLYRCMATSRNPTGLALKQIKALATSQFKTMNKEVNSNSTIAPVETSIRQKLMEQFSPIHLEVLNESYMHNVPKGAETHFKVVVISNKFADLPLIKRHRMVNDTLQEELSSGVHALSIMAKTPEQWEASKDISPSPACRGGFGK